MDQATKETDACCDCGVETSLEDPENWIDDNLYCTLCRDRLEIYHEVMAEDLIEEQRREDRYNDPRHTPKC